jgi:hypothetical protein
MFEFKYNLKAWPIIHCYVIGSPNSLEQINDLFDKLTNLQLRAQREKIKINLLCDCTKAGMFSVPQLIHINKIAQKNKTLTLLTIDKTAIIISAIPRVLIKLMFKMQKPFTPTDIFGTELEANKWLKK